MTKRPLVGVALVEALVAEGKRLVDEIATSESSLYQRRLAMGTFLLGARAQLPKRGTAEDGWGAFLAAIGVDDMTATRYMKIAEKVAALPLTERNKPQTYADAGMDNRPRKGDAGPDDGSMPRHEANGGYISPDDPPAPLELDPPAEIQIDRDTWCTPKDWAITIGPVAYDPCSNSRSHIIAARALDLELRGENGLTLASEMPSDELGFLNPPYSDVMPWVVAYRAKRTLWLLKFDPSTKWFELLVEYMSLVFFPRRTRMPFEAPEGIPKEMAMANQFPHAFFFAREEDVTDAMRARCYPPWRIR